MSEIEDVMERLRKLENKEAVNENQLKHITDKLDNLNSGINRGLWIIGGGFLAGLATWIMGGGLFGGQ